METLVEITCICGKNKKVRLADVNRGGGKYCSLDCFYKNNLKPRVEKVECICKCGRYFYVYKKSFEKGKAGKFCSVSCRGKFNTSKFKIGHTPYNYKGDDIKYETLHDYIRKNKKKTGKCEFCGKSNCRLEWANKSFKYKRDLNDWIELCVKCHRNYDKSNYGASLRVYGEKRKSKKLNKTGRIYSGPIKIIQMTMDGIEIKEWPSIRSIENELGIGFIRIKNACQTENNIVNSFRWKIKI